MNHLSTELKSTAIEDMLSQDSTVDIVALEFVGKSYNDFDTLAALVSHPKTPKNILADIARRHLTDVERGGHIHYLISENKSASMAIRLMSKVKGRHYAPDGTFFQTIALR